MAQIKLETAAIMQIQSQINQQYEVLQHVERIVSGVQNDLDWKIAATPQVRQALDALRHSSASEQQKLQAMAKMLLQVSNRFSEADRKLTKQAREVNSLAEHIGAASAGAGLTAVALGGMDLNLKVSELNKAFGIQGNDTLRDGTVRVIQAGKMTLSGKKNELRSGFGASVVAGTEQVVSGIKEIWRYGKENYASHGWVYDAVEYGKAAVKAGKGVVKIVGSVAAIASGVGIPIALCGIISAGNDIVSASVNATHVALDQYDQVGKANYLKDVLRERGGCLGEIAGRRETGEAIGEYVYAGLNLVSFLNGADKMLKSFGKINTDLTDVAGYSFVWGKTSFDDVMNNEFKWYKVDELVRSWFMDANSTANFVVEAVKNVNSVYQSGKKFFREIIETAFN